VKYRGSTVYIGV